MLKVTVVTSLVILLSWLEPTLGAFSFTTSRISDIQTAIKGGSMTCRQIVQGYLNRIDQYGNGVGSTLGAIISKNPTALTEADALDTYYSTNKQLKGKLHCAPLVVKDVIDVAGIPTTVGLNAFKSQIPLKDATVVANVKAQGAIIIAKANMSPLSDKEAWGHSETGGLIRNPFAINYTTYGSSGGNSAAANAMLAVGGIGSETGVSINLPSSTGNLVGFRPPVDVLKACNCRDGTLPNSIHQDVVGPMARSAEDAILIFDGMIGRENQYATSSVLTKSGLSGIKVNIFNLMAYGQFPFAGMQYSVDAKIQQLFTAAAANMAAGGATVKNVTIDFAAAAPSILNMFTKDYSSCIPGWRNDYYGDNTRFNSSAFKSFDAVVASNKLPSYYQATWEKIQNASKVSGQCNSDIAAFEAARSNLISQAINLILADSDVAIWPTVPQFPAKLGDDAFNKNWGSTTLAPINLVLLASWAGYPSVTVPMGFSDATTETPQGLPVGLFMMTTPEKFSTMLKVAYAYQENYGISKFPSNFPELTSSSTAAQGSSKSAAVSLVGDRTSTLSFMIAMLLAAVAGCF